ncbi:MAG: hypothetical protein V1769_00725 [Thermoplasmatota archaeon]
MKKICEILVCTLLILASCSISVSAGSEEDPEIVDKLFDVKIFGVIPFLPQTNFKNADFESVWFYEEKDDPDKLYICMKVRDLQSRSDTYDYIYVVDWTYHTVRYGAGIHLLPNGLTSFEAGTLDEEGNDYIDYVVCDGTFNTETDIITWIVPKSDIGNPTKWTKITDITPLTVIRFPQGSGKVAFDLFKDLPWNVKTSKEYVFQY